MLSWWLLLPIFSIISVIIFTTLIQNITLIITFNIFWIVFQLYFVTDQRFLHSYNIIQIHIIIYIIIRRRRFIICLRLWLCYYRIYWYCCRVVQEICIFYCYRYRNRNILLWYLIFLLIFLEIDKIIIILFISSLLINLTLL